MLFPGAPFPDDETKLDYSIALEYKGPPVPYEVPKIEPLDVSSCAIPIAEPLSESQRSAANTVPLFQLPRDLLTILQVILQSQWLMK
uniref:Uncharacterized protein MANES_15G192700 n=1 Tax=Rhizophora mucronata TaxID=61149 RepID=A0A2P2M7W1_RHIMU